MAPESAPSASARVRVFFALWPDASARAALARLAQEVARDGHGRAPRAANLHVTLAFIGEVPKARLDALADIGHQAAAGAIPFQLALERIGGTAYGIAWLAPQSLPEPLHAW